MPQYSKDIFNLAPGLGRAISDPREAEARAREASARAERDLRSQMQARLEAQRLQNEQIQLAGQAQLAQQGFQDRQLQQQADLFRAQMQSRQQENVAQRAFQEMMLGRQQDFSAQESLHGRNQQWDLAQAQQASARDNLLAQMGFEADKFNAQLDYREARDRLGDERYTQEYADKKARYADSRSDRKEDLKWRSERARVEDFFQQFALNQGQDRLTQADRHFNARREDSKAQFNANYSLQERKLREAAAQAQLQRLLGVVKPLFEQGGPVSYEDIRQASRMAQVAGVDPKALSGALNLLPKDRPGIIARLLSRVDENPSHTILGAGRSAIRSLFYDQGASPRIPESTLKNAAKGYTWDGKKWVRTGATWGD